ASIIDTQDGTTGAAQEFDIVQVRGEIPRCPRAKQDNWGLIMGRPRSRCLSYRPEPKAMQALALGVGESDLVSTQAEICWHLIAISIRQQNEGIEEAIEHCSHNA